MANRRNFSKAAGSLLEQRDPLGELPPCDICRFHPRTKEVIDERNMTEVAVDTTVMGKAITYPTDAKPCLEGLLRLNKQCRGRPR